jgi:hypothetical protein
MQTFQTPNPIAVDLELGVGNVRIEASDRTDTAVDVRPTDPSKPGDVRATEQTEVDFVAGRLQIKGMSGWRQWRSREAHSVDLVVELPAGSRLHAEVGVASLSTTGRLGDVHAKVGVGDAHVDEVAALNLKTGAGDVDVARVGGKAEVVTGSGAVRLGTVDGSTWVKNSNGDTWIDRSVGDVNVRAANGAIRIEHAGAGVVAKTANGRVQLGEVVRGTAVAESSFGDLEVGVRDGVPAWLDLRTKFGQVRNELETSDQPPSGEDSIEVHAHTSMGDIAIRRAFEGSDAA